MNSEFSEVIGSRAAVNICNISISPPAAKLAKKISSFAVIDLETNDLPNIWSKTAITELSIYAFACNELDVQPLAALMSPPATPRVLHKLTLLFNPRQRVSPDAEKLTGLSNEILEHESHFDENAANTVINFLKHLQQPVCLVAHNGNNFDFPIIKHSFEKLQKHLPSNIMCLDSMRAFVDMDKQLELVASSLEGWSDDDIKTNRRSPVVKPIVGASLRQESECTPLLAVKEEINWRLHNETTPKRLPASSMDACTKRSHVTLEANSNAQSATQKRQRVSLNVCRELFQKQGTWKFPPKNFYKLSNIFERKFRHSPAQIHHAESDVDMLMKLMQTYGVQFLAYAQNHAISFAAVPSHLTKLGSL